MSQLQGHCLCGETTFTCDAEPILVGHDHCDDCQRQTGSSYSLVVVVPYDKVKISGPHKKYSKKGDSGKDVHRIFCGECGSPIAHHAEAAKEIIALKGGCLKADQRAECAKKADTDIYGKDMLPNVPKLKNYNDKMP